ncbi:hypothetical protein [Azospirillum sp.]|uniref:hypothetical protein n=1 Tax=Azospirillum sp. TaxID=34012 RepID=UPI002D45C76E|nr:hypothetical protein [Azospirillum sp.]HYD66984.1 hypothetical protein [Azospirillum sp.]
MRVAAARSSKALPKALPDALQRTVMSMVGTPPVGPAVGCGRGMNIMGVYVARYFL